MTGAGDSRGPSRPRRRPAALDVTVSSSAGVRAPLGREAVAELARAVLAAERVRSAEVSITFLPADEMARLNWRHLRHRGATDIITFELAAVPGAPVSGDVYICPEVARANARAHGAGVREEVARLVVHGMLHVLGHEHPEDETRVASPMWRAQERHLARLWPGRAGTRGARA